MRINKLLGALGNLNKIAEGIKNKIFKNDDDFKNVRFVH